MTQSEERLIPLNLIRTDNAIQPLLKLDKRWMEALAKAMSDECGLPPVVCFYDGESYWLADGLDRLEAAQLTEQKTTLVDIHQGSLQEAIAYSKHKSWRSNKEKRQVVDRFLSLLESMGEEEKKYWSNIQISDYCGVSHSYVGQRMKKVGYKQPSELVRKSSKGKIYARNISPVQQNRKSTQKESGFDWTAIDDKQFEELVYEIVKSYNPTYMDWRNGSGGKGRDIEAKFKLKGGLDEEKEELYFIEAKHSIKEGIKWTKISDAFTWAERYNPSVLVIATSKHLTNPCKDEVSDWKNNHSHIHVIRWERKDIEELIRSKPSVRSIAIQFRIISKFMQ